MSVWWLTEVLEQSPSGVPGVGKAGKDSGDEAPGKLSTFTYLTVSFDCNFAHERPEYAKQSVYLVHLQSPGEMHSPHSSPCIRPCKNVSRLQKVLLLPNLNLQDARLGRMWFHYLQMRFLRSSTSSIQEVSANHMLNSSTVCLCHS